MLSFPPTPILSVGCKPVTKVSRYYIDSVLVKLVMAESVVIFAVASEVRDENC